MGDYRIATAAAAKKEETGVVQGGASIMIRESAQKYITKITRQSSRVIKETLDRQHSNMPIQIISTYAPHNGHAEEDRTQHWKEVKGILNKTCKRHMIIWCADANGQLGRDKEEGKKPQRKHRTQQDRTIHRSKENRKNDMAHTLQDYANNTK